MSGVSARKDSSMSGFFISFEGIDGSGKSTQCEILAQTLREYGYETCVTREPNNGTISQLIREGWTCPRTKLLLFLADRAQHLATVVEPALTAGEIVVCDRSIDSTIAYQGYGEGFGREQIEQLMEAAQVRCYPDLTFLCDLPPREAYRRIQQRGAGTDYFEQKGEAFFEQVRQGYLVIAREEIRRVVVVDATCSADQIEEEVWRIFCERYTASQQRGAGHDQQIAAGKAQWGRGLSGRHSALDAPQYALGKAHAPSHRVWRLGTRSA